MQEPIEMYTDDELLKYYSLLTPEGRAVRRVLSSILHEIEFIDENTELTKLMQLYEKLERILPQEFSNKLEKGIKEGCVLDISKANDNNGILISAYRLYSVYYSKNIIR